jgi:hypothetical protein
VTHLWLAVASAKTIASSLKLSSLSVATRRLDKIMQEVAIECAIVETMVTLHVG